jgi:hypothetical protein
MGTHRRLLWIAAAGVALLALLAPPVLAHEGDDGGAASTVAWGLAVFDYGPDRSIDGDQDGTADADNYMGQQADAAIELDGQSMAGNGRLPFEAGSWHTLAAPDSLTWAGDGRAYVFCGWWARDPGHRGPLSGDQAISFTVPAATGDEVDAYYEAQYFPAGYGCPID